MGTFYHHISKRKEDINLIEATAQFPIDLPINSKPFNKMSRPLNHLSQALLPIHLHFLNHCVPLVVLQGQIWGQEYPLRFLGSYAPVHRLSPAIHKALERKARALSGISGRVS